ncbi:hypothetical protein [Lacticaseibacillus saniviri]|uniref:Uncharacterized protein n=1 Tax=Lacticaseibacillus saniviri JCM 17471 = DSM 24301 TaxID=1293598 RepID=A0A0R2MPM2_9LACO|nr:hypothetical protein [Lacticaseibacillus saniviri]KRO15593.1 hypothetical protein IV56_GL002363 [Lacticaseibacillus saniviri JCM 17471 = DSM 24301]MCG4281167.1 hypothetical protein [Lacticaseibacillus saniviri]
MTQRRKTYLFWAAIVIIASLFGTYMNNEIVRLGQVFITVYALYRLLKMDGALKRAERAAHRTKI